MYSTLTFTRDTYLSVHELEAILCLGKVLPRIKKVKMYLTEKINMP